MSTCPTCEQTFWSKYVFRWLIFNLLFSFKKKKKKSVVGQILQRETGSCWNHGDTDHENSALSCQANKPAVSGPAFQAKVESSSSSSRRSFSLSVLVCALCCLPVAKRWWFDHSHDMGPDRMRLNHSIKQDLLQFCVQSKRWGAPQAAQPQQHSFFRMTLVASDQN